MNRILILLHLCLFSSLLSAQPERARIQVSWEGSIVPWNHLEVNNPAGSFQFAIVTDRTGGHRPGIFPDAIRKLNLLQPEFVMSVGDLIEGYTTDTAELERQWDEFTGFISGLEMPFFYVPGNHDITNPLMEEIWKQRFGTTHYYFTYQDVLFVCLNSEDQARGAGKGTISQPQYEWVKKVLAENTGVKWTLLFMHQPLWTQENPEMWPEVEKLLANRKHTVFVGHNHRYVRYERNNGKYFILATTGGSSALRGPRFGEFDHVVWVTMTDEGPIIANLLLDGIWEEGVVTEEFADKMRPVLRQQPILIEPLLTAEETFDGAVVKVRVTNPTDFPMYLEMECESNETIWAAMTEIEDSIGPNQVQIYEIPLRTEGAVQVADLKPLEMEATCTYLMEGQPELEVEMEFRFRPEKLFPIGKTTKPVQVDGRLDDWEELPFSSEAQVYVESDPFSHQGAADGSFRFGIREDAQFLYVAVDVTDDDVEVADATSPFSQDMAGIFIDARPQNIAANGRLRDYSESLRLLCSVSEAGSGDANLFERASMPPGIAAKAVRTSKGYSVEVAIPHAVLDYFHQSTWKSLRLNVGMRDYDKQGIHETTLLWEPLWNSKENRVGSGMFRRE